MVERPTRRHLLFLATRFLLRLLVENSVSRVLAQVNGFELNTERETVDTTALSEEFRSRANTLISGSGRMNAFWEYTGDTTNELPNYLVELSLRTKVGSQFRGKFYIKRNDYNPSGVAARANDEIYYDFKGVITSCAVQFAPDNTVQITADFVTTGAIQLKMNLIVRLTPCCRKAATTYFWIKMQALNLF